MNGFRDSNQLDEPRHSGKGKPEDLNSDAKTSERPMPLATMPAKASPFLPPMPDVGAGIMQWGLND